MPSKSKFTRDDNGNIAVRVVSNDSSVTNSDSMFTTDENGNVAVRVVGSGGGDQHNLGYYATPEALTEAYPTAEAGDWAIVGSTDTVWIWDTDTSAWKDSDTKGQVTSVNNQTGAVTITDTDILPSQTGHSGQILGTDGFVAGWVKPEIVQRSTMPQASEDELGKVYQFVGTTDATYTNGYFYKCVSDGQNPATYSWSQTNVQPAPSGLPSQTGNSGKFLTTDGTDASWSDKPLVNNTAQQNSISILGTSLTAHGSYNTVVGASCTIYPDFSSSNVVIGSSVSINGSTATSNSIAIGSNVVLYGNRNTVIGKNIGVSGNNYGTVVLGANGGNNFTYATESESLFFVVGTNVYKVVASDGTIPTDRFTTTPVADGTYVPTVSISSGVATRSWTTPASAPVVPATMPTLAVADWSSNTQTVNVTGVTASNVVFVAPAPASAADYAAAGIVCIAQGAGTLTFTCTTVPSNAITVNVVILG